MDTQQQSTPERTAIAIGWFAGCASLVASLVALVPGTAARVVAGAAALALALWLTPRVMQRGSRLANVAIVLAPLVVAMFAATWISEGTLLSMTAWSHSGGAGMAGAWLFTWAVLCVAVGTLSSSWLLLSDGVAAGHITVRTMRRAFVLPVLAAAGWAVIGVVPVSNELMPTRIHNLAGVVTVGTLIASIALTALVRRLPRSLRIYSATAAVIIAWFWAPTIFTFVAVTDRAPLASMALQALAFAALAIWYVWLVRTWDRARSECGNTHAPETPQICAEQTP